ncbi:MAG: hydrogenase subunit MbhD domain-containing protein [Opitutales bacterium]
MNWQIEIVLYLLLLTTAVLALQVKDLLAAALAATAFSFTVALLFISMGAIDVGFTEAAVGAGIVGVFFVAAIYKTTRRTRD